MRTWRADRQPEFTQIDLEMSFMDVDEILELTEGFIKKLMKDVLDVDITIPLPRLTYNDAMSRYGSDSPIHASVWRYRICPIL